MGGFATIMVGGFTFKLLILTALSLSLVGGGKIKVQFIPIQQY